MRHIGTAYRAYIIGREFLLLGLYYIVAYIALEMMFFCHIPGCCLSVIFSTIRRSVLRGFTLDNIVII